MSRVASTPVSTGSVPWGQPSIEIPVCGRVIHGDTGLDWASMNLRSGTRDTGVVQIISGVTFKIDVADRGFSLEEQVDNREWLALSEKSFAFWDNPADAIYDDL